MYVQKGFMLDGLHPNTDSRYFIMGACQPKAQISNYVSAGFLNRMAVRGKVHICGDFF